MLISKPTLYNDRESTIINSIIQYKNGKKMQIFFEVPREFGHHIDLDSSPFLSALVIPCMKAGEDIQVMGSVSKKLKSQVESIQNLLISWNVGFNRINVEIETTSKNYKKGPFIGQFFSAGVDSFSSYLKSKNESIFNINEFIFVHGFDIPLKESALFLETLRVIQNVAQSEKIKLVTVRTNIRELTDQYLSWDFAHGGALASIGLLLRNRYQSIVIPGNGAKEVMYAWGTHPELDPLWSTENLTIIHDLDELSRLQKVEKYIAKSELALQALRVCWKNRNYNCCRCDKCLRTMIELQIADVLDKSTAFQEPLQLNLVRSIYSQGPSSSSHLEDCLKELKRKKQDIALQEAILVSLHAGKNPTIFRRIVKKINYLDKKYNQDRLYKWMVAKKIWN